MLSLNFHLSSSVDDDDDGDDDDGDDDDGDDDKILHKVYHISNFVISLNLLFASFSSHPL